MKWILVKMTTTTNIYIWKAKEKWKKFICLLLAPDQKAAKQRIKKSKLYN